MQITRQADYAIRAVFYLAGKENGKLVATGQVAKEQNIPSSFLAKIFSQLSNMGLIHTSPGARGGVALAREPRNITLLEVIEAIDGPIHLNVCVEADGFCSLEDICPIRSVWRDAQQELITKLRDITFAQLIAQIS